MKQKLRNKILTTYHTTPPITHMIAQKLNINLNACKNENAIQTLMPYAFAGGWVFDDETTGLVREAFVCGMDDILTEMVNRAGIEDAADGFRLTFSATPFPNYTHSFEWVRPEMGGNIYYCPENEITGWLCPALFKYFKKAPKRLYARADSAQSVDRPADNTVLIDSVIEQIKDDLAWEDTTAIAELLENVPEANLLGYLGERYLNTQKNDAPE